MGMYRFWNERLSNQGREGRVDHRRAQAQGGQPRGQRFFNRDQQCLVGHGGATMVLAQQPGGLHQPGQRSAYLPKRLWRSVHQPEIALHVEQHVTHL